MECRCRECVCVYWWNWIMYPIHNFGVMFIKSLTLKSLHTTKHEFKSNAHLKMQRKRNKVITFCSRFFLFLIICFVLFFHNSFVCFACLPAYGWAGAKMFFFWGSSNRCHLIIPFYLIYWARTRHKLCWRRCRLSVLVRAGESEGEATTEALNTLALFYSHIDKRAKQNENSMSVLTCLAYIWRNANGIWNHIQ